MVVLSVINNSLLQQASPLALLAEVVPTRLKCCPNGWPAAPKPARQGLQQYQDLPECPLDILHVLLGTCVGQVVSLSASFNFRVTSADTR
jgi:hypothetical protein